MNDRIREPYYSLMYKASIGWNEFLFQVPPELLEKYSELIIKECCRIVNLWTDEDLPEGREDVMQTIWIKKIFGVEE